MPVVAAARSASQLDGLDKPARIEVYSPDADEFIVTMAALRAHVLGGCEEGNPFREIGAA